MQSAEDLGREHSLIPLDGLVLEESIVHNAGGVNDAAQRAEPAGALDGAGELGGIGDVGGDDLDTNVAGVKLLQSVALGLAPEAAAAGEHEAAGAALGEPGGEAQTEAAEAAGDEIAGVALAHKAAGGGAEAGGAGHPGDVTAPATEEELVFAALGHKLGEQGLGCIIGGAGGIEPLAGRIKIDAHKA
jgi:hypothetical protein